jgi:hypothetical protein
MSWKRQSKAGYVLGTRCNDSGHFSLSCGDKTKVPWRELLIYHRMSAAPANGEEASRGALSSNPAAQTECSDFHETCQLIDRRNPRARCPELAALL